MRNPYTIFDRRLALTFVLGDFVAGALTFPVAAIAVPSTMLAKEATQAVLPTLPFGLLLLNSIILLLNPPEPVVWSVPSAVAAGVWRATLLFIALLWVMLLTGSGNAVPLGLFVVAWGVLALMSALTRIARLLATKRVSI